MEFTLHIRGIDDPTGDYTLTAILFYENKNPPQDQKTENLTFRHWMKPTINHG